jgi:hypothetical protein
MITTQKASDICSPITAHRVFLLHLESMRLLGEESRCEGRLQKKSEARKARWRGLGARGLRWMALLAFLTAPVC